MKKLALLLMSLFVLISCSNDDDATEKTASLIGVWQMVKEETISGEDNQTVIEVFTPDDCETKNTMSFKDNNEVHFTNFTLNNSGECVNQGIDKYNYTYNKNENTVTFFSTDDDEKTVNKILKLTSTELILEDRENYDNNDYFFRITFKRK